MARQIKLDVEHVNYMPDYYEEGTLYVSYVFGLAICLCPCGCGEHCVMPLKPNDPDGWVFQEDERGVTLSPSILETTCPNKSHFFIENSKIRWV